MRWANGRNITRAHLLSVSTIPLALIGRLIPGRGVRHLYFHAKEKRFQYSVSVGDQLAYPPSHASSLPRPLFELTPGSRLFRLHAT